MEEHYETLITINEIVKEDSSPTTYLVTPHEIILRQHLNWNVIEKHLELLANEKSITIKQLDKMAILITDVGMAKAKSLQENLKN